MARRKPDDEDLVPYYRPGTTEPEMVPRSSVPGYVAPGEEAEEEDQPLDEKAEDAAEEKPSKRASKAPRVAKKK